MSFQALSWQTAQAGEGMALVPVPQISYGQGCEGSQLAFPHPAPSLCPLPAWGTFTGSFSLPISIQNIIPAKELKGQRLTTGQSWSVCDFEGVCGESFGKLLVTHSATLEDRGR